MIAQVRWFVDRIVVRLSARVKTTVTVIMYVNRAVVCPSVRAKKTVMRLRFVLSSTANWNAGKIQTAMEIWFAAAIVAKLNVYRLMIVMMMKCARNRNVFLHANPNQIVSQVSFVKKENAFRIRRGVHTMMSVMLRQGSIAASIIAEIQGLNATKIQTVRGYMFAKPTDARQSATTVQTVRITWSAAGSNANQSVCRIAIAPYRLIAKTQDVHCRVRIMTIVCRHIYVNRSNVLQNVQRVRNAVAA